jgi:DNA repair protein RecN (Recombination protein N)
MGERADKSLVRSGEESCTVEGVFHLTQKSPLHAVLEESGADPCEDGALIIRRGVNAAGGGRQFANGSPCTLALLRRLGDLLVDLHGPHDHQSLFSRDQQMLVLDAFADAEALRDRFASARKNWLHLAAEKKLLSEDSEALGRERDLLTRQVAEIFDAALRPGEEEQLVARQKTSANARRLSE